MEDRVKPTITWINTATLITATLITLSMGLLYIYGDTYLGGFLQEFKLCRILFEVSFEQTLVAGFRTLAIDIPMKNHKSILIFALAIGGIQGIFFATLEIIRKRRIHLGSLLLVFRLMVGSFALLLILGIFMTFYNYALKEGSQYAIQLKREIDAESNLKGKEIKLPKAIILYDGYGNNRPKQLIGYIIVSSPKGFAIYMEGKVNFIPMSQIIQVSFPVKQR